MWRSHGCVRDEIEKVLVSEKLSEEGKETVEG